jgi:acyl-CoA synthetase (AMP-forming)/AMP-acid ligase II
MRYAQKRPGRRKMRSTMMQTPLSLNTLLEHANKLYPTREVVSRRPDKSLHRCNYGAVYKHARQLAQALTRAGVGRGEAVGTLMWNHWAHLEAYFGIPAAGAVLHTLNLRLSAEDLAYIIGDAGDRLILIDDVLLPVWEKVKPLLANAPRAVVFAFSGAPVPADYESYEDFIAADASGYRYPEQDENDAMGMCYTSGTTGRPKGVVYSHRSMVLHSIVTSVPDVVGTSMRDSVLVVTPMFHANAWAMPFAALMLGAKQVFPGPHMAGEDLLDLMERERVTLALGVPTVWMMVLQALQSGKRSWNLVEGMRMTVGGAPVPRSLIEAFDTFGLNIRQGWGMTETSPVGSLTSIKPHLAGAPAETLYAIRARAGLQLPLVELRIVDDAGRELPWDGESTGELQCRGPWVAAGYHNQPTDSEKFTADGWLRTGDVATIDAEGYMRIADRTKDLIKSGGEWISSVDLENAIMGHPAVAEAAVVAVRHPKWDERPLAVVVKKQGWEVAPGELRELLLAHFAKWQVPDDFAFVDTIPRTSTGKFLKTKLREQFKDWVSKTP